MCFSGPVLFSWAPASFFNCSQKAECIFGSMWPSRENMFVQNTWPLFGKISKMFKMVLGYSLLHFFAPPGIYEIVPDSAPAKLVLSVSTYPELLQTETLTTDTAKPILGAHGLDIDFPINTHPSWSSVSQHYPVPYLCFPAAKQKKPARARSHTY